MPGRALGGGPVSRSRIFPGSKDQVRAVQDFARNALSGHPARDDAVLVASELATNSIRHSASGAGGGLFLVYLTEVSATHVAVLVTDQGGTSEPRAEAAADGAESGRGLAVVKSLTFVFVIVGGDGAIRSALAVVPADPPAGNDDWSTA